MKKKISVIKQRGERKIRRHVHRHSTPRGSVLLQYKRGDSGRNTLAPETYCGSGVKSPYLYLPLPTKGPKYFGDSL